MLAKGYVTNTESHALCIFVTWSFSGRP